MPPYEDWARGAARAHLANDAGALLIFRDAVEIAQWERFTAVILRLNTLVCVVCGGYGHDHQTCPTKSTLDGIAKANAVSWQWGAIKGAHYFSRWKA